MKVTLTRNEVPQEKCFEDKLDEVVEISETKKLSQEDKSLEENVDQEAEILQKEKVILVREEIEKHEDMTTERLEKGTEVEVKVEVANLQQEIGEGKVTETKIDLPKKLRQISTQNHKMKVTVPKPFSLETEKRMFRERRGGSMDFNDSKPNLSKSLSLNYKNTSQSYLGPERSSDLRGNTSSSTTKTVVNGSSRKEKGNIKVMEKKKPQVVVKKQEGNELSNNKLQKNPTFKALPLPSFYHKKDSPPKPQTNKIRVTHSKPPLATELTKTASKTDNKKIEEKERKVSGKNRSSAKETISKLFKATRNSLSNPKEKVKAAVSGA